MDTSTTSIEGGSNAKKVSLEEMTKEELVKKCRNLLTIAQKAKQARDVLIEENNKLKQSPPAAEELIASFTQQKLDLITKNDSLQHEKKQLEDENCELRNELNAVEDKAAGLDTECQGYKRQVSRLTEENEQLLTHLDGLEAQINELKRIGLEQQQQLLILEQNNAVDELQKMLAVSLEEVKKLKDENTNIQEILSEKEAQIIILNDTLTNHDFNSQKFDESKALLLQRDEELNRQVAVVDDLNTELHKNRALAQKLKQDISNTSKRFNDNQIESSGINAELQNHNEKLREKLKCYHGKIVKLAGDVRKVKESKDYILETFKVYNQQVQVWKEQLMTVSVRIQDEVKLNLEEKNKFAKSIEVLREELKEMGNVKIENENLHKTVDVMRSQIANFEAELSKMRDSNDLDGNNKQKLLDEVKLLLEGKNDECRQLQGQLAEEKRILSELKTTFEEQTMEFKEMQATQFTRSDDFSKLKQEFDEIKIQKDSLETEKSAWIKEKLSWEDAKVHFETTIEDNTRLVSELQRVIEKLESDARQAQLSNEKEGYERLKREVNELKSTLKAKTIELNNKQDECERLQAEMSKLSKLKQDFDSMKEQYESVSCDLDEIKIRNDCLENEKSSWIKEKVWFETTIEDNTRLVGELKRAIEKLESDACQSQLSKEKEGYERLKQEFDNLKSTFEGKTIEFNNKNDECQRLMHELDELKVKHDESAKLVAEMQATQCTQSDELSHLEERLENEKMTWEVVKSQFEATIEGNTRLVSELKKAIERLESDAEQSRVTESKLAEQTSATILQLRQENKTLEDKFDDLRRQQEAQPVGKSENSELLAEMNVMNQALKERGETISQQQAHCEELVKKIQVYEGQLAKSQENVQHLQDEVLSLRGQVSQDDYDALSTSTISRSDEINRMKELDGSWEERYGKLRTYAVKLKAKAKELQDDLRRVEGEKSEVHGRVAGNMKTVQSMQGQIDALQDKLDAQKEGKGRLDQVNKDNQRLLQQLASNEETIQKLKTQVEGLTQEKINLDVWKKQVGTKVQALKKELEANTLMRKDFESRIQKLQVDLTSKEKELTAEKEKHGNTRSQLQESNTECKKQSVLNLEMQDYERSIKELSSKLEKKNDQVTKLKNQIDAQKSSVSSTKEQNRLLEEKSGELELELDACRIEIRTFKKQIADLEITIGDKENAIDEGRMSLENMRSENEDLSTQLSKIIAEHQKVNQLLRDEKDHFRNENVDMESRVRQLTDQLKLKTDELENINGEYQSYKVRAQSVLRQNQSRDVGVEEKLTEEAASLRAQMRIYQSEAEELRQKLKTLEALNQKLSDDKNELEISQKDIQMDLDNVQSEIDKLNSKHLQMIQEHNETVRSLKLHTETLSQCYRQQISEQEVRHNREIIELQSKYDKNPAPHTDIPSLIIPTSIREEGEGSESVDSANGNTIHPLEKLLGSDQDQELAAVRKQLNENELRVVHLTALLADTEQDLSKHMQMNKVLKEEIRRQQRSVERERHAENLEYMKNVVFKFITLNNGDERLRLVPVLNTILKLSPEETNKLNLVAKGDKSWSNYLPLWTGAGGSKPQ